MNEYVNVKKLWLYVMGASIAVLVVLLAIVYKPYNVYGETGTMLTETEAIEMAVDIVEKRYAENGYEAIMADPAKAEAELEDGVWTVTVWLTWNGMDVYNQVVLQPVYMMTGA